MDEIKQILQTIESAEMQRDAGYNNDRADFLVKLATAKSLAVIAQAAALYISETEHVNNMFTAASPAVFGFDEKRINDLAEEYNLDPQSLEWGKP